VAGDAATIVPINTATLSRKGLSSCKINLHLETNVLNLFGGRDNCIVSELIINPKYFTTCEAFNCVLLFMTKPRDLNKSNVRA